MGKHFIIFLISTQWLFSAIVYAGCDADLGNDQPARSRWGLVFEKNHVNDRYLAIKRNQPAATIQYQQQSLARGDEQFVRIIQDLDAWMVGPTDLNTLYLEQYQRFPTREEIIEYFEGRLQLIRDGINELDWRLKISSPQSEAKFVENWKTWLKQIEVGTAKLREAQGPEKITAMARGLFNIEVGFLAEVRSVFVFEGIDEAGVVLRNHPLFASKVEESMSAFIEKAKHNPKLLLDDLKANPMMYKAVAYTKNQKMELLKEGKVEDVNKAVLVPESDFEQYFSNPSNVIRYLTEVKEWILAKEVDFIRVYSDGTFGWIEAKGTSSPDTIEKLIVNPSGKKTRIKQLQEDLSIIRFIGMENKIKLQYYSTGGVTEEARAYLESFGVEVL